MNVSLRMTVTAFFGSISQHALCLQIPLSHLEKGGLLGKAQNTEYLKSQDKGYQETIDQTDLELATDKNKKFTSIMIVYKFLHKKRIRLLIS